MFFISDTIPVAGLIEQQNNIADQVSTPSPGRQIRNWQSLLENVYNRNLKFEVKWVAIHKKKGGYYKQSTPIDGIPPPPPAIILLDDRQVSSLLDYDDDLRIFILNSPKIYWLSNTNDPKVLDELVQLLDVPDRAWAANVTLAKMLGKASLGDFEIRVDKAEQWWETGGKTGKAKQEWAAYLDKVRPTLKWSVLGGYYKHITPEGEKVP
jgi:hypothetical protein